MHGEEQGGGGEVVGGVGLQEVAVSALEAEQRGAASAEGGGVKSRCSSVAAMDRRQ